ncbi:YdcF family protein [Blautia sp.]|uniref:DUF218 domain-containing protein n=1 Tax=Blautia glucerasea TaxID=536633 RepID=A0A6N2TJU7_9FIRM
MDSYQKFLKDTEDFIFIENEPEKADMIFVPGNGYPHMAERAASLYKEGFAPRVLPSGRFSVTLGKFSGVLKKAELYQGDYATEWEFLRDVLIKNGVDQENILKEECATFTWENALLSRRVTDEAGISVKKAILCCKSYHARRVLMYYQRAFPETEFFVCPSYPDGINRNNWRDTEESINEVMGEVKRIIMQFSLMMQ